MKRRVLTMLLALVMVLGLFPASTFADDVAAEPARIVTADPAVYAPEGEDLDLPSEKDDAPAESEDEAEPAEPSDEPSEDVGPWYDDYGTQYYRDHSDGRIYYVADDVTPFVVNAGKTEVSISKGEKAFPEGAKLRVYLLDGNDAAEYIEAVEDQSGLGVDNAQVMDIVILDENGMKCQPKDAVKLSFSGPGIDTTSKVWHFKDSGTKNRGKLIADELAQAEEDPEETNGNENGAKGGNSGKGNNGKGNNGKGNNDNGDNGNNGKKGGNRVTVSTDSFSVYVVVPTVTPRLTVTFKNGSTEIASMIIKKADTADEVEKIIYDPGAGTVPAGQAFKGWTTTQEYTTSTDLKTIAEVRTDAMTTAASITEDTTVTYYAAIFKSYTITYLSDDTPAITVGTAAAEYPSYKTEPVEVPYTVNMGYTVDDKHNFEGWTADTNSQGHIKDYPIGAAFETVVVGSTNTTVYYYTNDTEITITGDITFTVRAPEGAWLVFDETCNKTVKGATYTAPQFVLKGDVTKTPSTFNSMACNGYTFGGWYDTAAHALAHAANENVTEGRFEFGNPLTAGTTIYASWIPNANASYTVIFWTQNQGRTGYEVAGSTVIENGNVGQPIPYTVVENNAEDYVTGFGNNYGHYTGFGLTAASKNQQVMITPEGDAVLNLYYDRIEYNFKFYLYRDGTQNNRYDYANNSGGGSDLNGVVTWHSNQTAHPSVTGYTIQSETVGGRTYYYFVMQAYYGEDISSKWPTYDKITGANGRDPVSYVMMVGTALKPNPTTSGSGTVKGVISVLNENILGATEDPNGNYVVVRFPGSYYNWRYHIWFETVEGEDYTGKTTRTYNGKTYYEDNVMEVRSSNTEVGSQNEPKYVGFEFVEKRGQNWNNSNYWTTGNNPTLYHLNFVYNRELYKISYFDGNYVDGNENQIQNRAEHLLHESGSIGQGATIADEYKNYEPTCPESGYVFEGWYLDEGCTTPYTWSKMPVGGIQVYAKWRQIQYRVFLHTGLTEIDDTHLYWGSASQSLSFRVAYNGTVSTPTGTRDGYKFLGWYTADGKAWTDSTKLNDTTVTDPYDKSVPTDPETKDNAGTSWYGPWDVGTSGTNSDAENNRTWITKKLDIYAKWSKVLEDADGINVVYNADGFDLTGNSVTGTNPPTDGATYIENSNVSAGAAATAPEGYVFDHWVVETWSNTQYTYNNSSVTVLPGETFAAKESDAKVVDNGDGTKTYTVEVLAIYKKVEEATPTHIAWYSNYGDENGGKGIEYRYDTKDAEENDTLMINDAVIIYGLGDGESIPTRDGYTFKGWTKTQGGTTADFLIWTGSGYTDASNRAATQVAADEKDPIEDLFAVWQEQYFYVFHSSNATVERVGIGKYVGKTCDLTNMVLTGYLYGGYYSNCALLDGTDTMNAKIALAAEEGSAELPAAYKYDGSSLKCGDVRFWTKGNAYLATAGAAPGNAITPTVGEVYYLKEVPKNYLCSRISFVYDYLNSNALEKLYLITAVDDNYYSGTYIKVTDNKEYTTKLASSFTITQRNSTNRVVTNASSFDLTRAYIGYAEVSTLLKENSTFTMTPQWLTLDGVLVNGTPRTFQITTLTKDGISEVTP